MKRDVATPLCLGLAVMALGCGGERAPDATASEGGAFCARVTADVEAFMAGHELATGERYGGTAVVGTLGEFDQGMNALVSSDFAANQHQVFVNLMSLIRLDENLELIPYLARSWEMAEDDTELTFHLREDVYWHDGRRTTAYDVEFTYLRATDPATGFSNSAFWTSYESGPEGVEVVDSFTVVFRLRPHAELLAPWSAVAIMPRHLLEDVPPAELRQHPYGSVCPVGNGPFRFVEHRTDDRWVFTANPTFPAELGGRPYLDRYVYRIIPEQATLLGELLTEGIDVYISPLPDQAPDIVESSVTRLVNFPFRSFVFIGWNSRRPQLADARVRRAISMATNRREVVGALLSGYGTVANSGVPPFHWAHDPSLADSIPYDPTAAEALLEAAGWTDRDGDGVRENSDGLPLRISVKYNQGNRQRQDVAEIMQAQLARVGISVRPQVVEWTTLLSQINTPEVRDFDGFVLSWVTELKVDETDLFHSSAFDQPLGWSGTRAPELDRLLDTLQVIVDREDALPFWREYQNRVLREQPFMYFFYPDRLEGINLRLQDVQMDVRGELVNIKDWWIPEEQRRFVARGSGR